MGVVRVSRFGEYFLTRRVALGGMAELYRARKIGPAGFEKLVAIKRLLPHLAADAEFRTMFLNEARLASLLNHQNIVQVYDLGRMEDDESLPEGHRGTYFIAMEYVFGKSLAEILRKGQERGLPLPSELTTRIILAGAAGLAYAHARRDEHNRPLELVHRDVSPQNLLISYEGETKLVDFGIAKALSHSTTTRPGTLKGKFGYMSPEQARGESVDRRADIYSLGIVFWEALADRRLFVGDNDAAVLNQVLNPQIVAPSVHRPEVPPELDVICLRCLEPDPDRRFADAQDLAEDLEGYLHSLGSYPSTYSLRNHLYELFGEEIGSETQAIEEELEAARAAAEGRDDGGQAWVAARQPAMEATRVLPSPVKASNWHVWLAIGMALVIASLAVALWLWPRAPLSHRVSSEPEPQARPSVPAAEAEPARTAAQPTPLDRLAADHRWTQALQALREKQYDSALESFAGLAPDHPGALATIHRQQAAALVGRAANRTAQAPEMALQDLAEAASLAPDWSEPPFQSGRVHTHLKENAKALADYQRALELDPRLDGALFNRGYIHLEEGRLAQAVTDFERVVDLGSPHAADAQVNLAVAHARLGQPDKAREHLRAALTLNPNHKLALSYMQKLERRPTGGDRR